MRFSKREIKRLVKSGDEDVLMHLVKTRLYEKDRPLIEYRGYWIEYDPKPIPIRRHDWSFWHDDYDGAPVEPGDPPADHRCGTAETLEAAMRAIDEQIAEEASK